MKRSVLEFRGRIFAFLFIVIAEGLANWACSADDDSTNHSRTQALIDEVDERHPVAPTEAVPYRSVAALSIVFGTSQRICSGVILSPNSLLTAGHCLFQDGVAATKVSAYLDRFTESSPGKEVCIANWTVHPRWLDTADSQFDFALVTLCRPTEVPPIQISPASALVGQKARLAGYPGDLGGDELVESSGEITAIDTSTGRLIHNLDTTEGMSGSPIWGSDGRLLGIHTSGVNWGDRVSNFAVRSDRMLSAWVSAPCQDECNMAADRCRALSSASCQLDELGCARLTESEGGSSEACENASEESASGRRATPTQEDNENGCTVAQVNGETTKRQPSWLFLLEVLVIIAARRRVSSSGKHSVSPSS